MSRASIIGLVVAVILLLLLPLVFNNFMTQIAVSTITYAMLGLAFALGMRVGLPRLDIISFYGIGAYTTGLLTVNLHMNFWLATLLAGLCSVIIGGILHSLSVPRGMLAFFVFCMVLSMAVYQMFGSVPIFGGWGGLTGIPPATLGSLVFDTQTKVYYLGIFFLALTSTVYYLLYHSRIGRAWDAISSSLALARSVGVDVVRYRLSAVLIGNFFIGVAGSFFVSYYRAAIPAIFGFNTGVLVLVYLIIGGMGHSLVGPILGAIIATFVPEYLRFAQSYQAIATAVIVLLILMFLPMGVLGWIDKHIMSRLNKMRWYSRYIVGVKT